MWAVPSQLLTDGDWFVIIQKDKLSYLKSPVKVNKGGAMFKPSRFIGVFILQAAIVFYLSEDVKVAIGAAFLVPAVALASLSLFGLLSWVALDIYFEFMAPLTAAIIVGLAAIYVHALLIV